MPRTCGACTACCKTHGVEELKKERGVTCKHCAVGAGCAIYATRPPSCAEFTCLWLSGVGLEEDRPDRLKLVMDVHVSPLLQVMLVGLWETETGILDGETSRRWRGIFLRAGHLVSEWRLSAKSVLFVPLTFPLNAEQKKQIEKEEMVLVGVRVP